MSKMKMWFEKFNTPERSFATAPEYTAYMTENRLWGSHPKSMTHEEWEKIKADAKAKDGTELGTAAFNVGSVKKQ